MTGSITAWTRLEPSGVAQDMTDGLRATVHDPLWLLARQWQLLEFRGEDGGSPVAARVRLDRHQLHTLHPGGSGDHVPYDPATAPLESLTERETDGTTGGVDLRLTADIGLRFLALLAEQDLATYRAAYLDHYALRAPLADDDPAVAAFLRLVAGRAPDGLRLFADLFATLGPDGDDTLPAAPDIDPDDRDAVRAVALRWLRWVSTVRAEPATTDAWIPERMEYDLAASASTADGPLRLRAREHDGADLDWYTFDVEAPTDGPAPDGEPEPIARTVIPSPVTYAGMPADRWWEFEDAGVRWGDVSAGPAELHRLLLTEFALVHGQDWFTVPVDLPVGAVYRVRSLVVTDTFGGRTLIPHHRDVDHPARDWRVFCHDRADGAPADLDALFVAPAVASRLEGPPIEEVLLLRDELANMAWAVERVVEGPLGRPVSRVDEQRISAAVAGDGDTAGESVRYRLATPVPPYWLPLVPVRITADDPAVRLQRARLLSSGGDGPTLPVARGRILAPDEPLALREEEVPRAGVRVTRAYRYTRWIDGSTHLWVGRRKSVGRGEGRSGLRFDLLEPDA